ELARRTRRAALPWQLGFQAAQPDEPRSSSSAPPPAAGSREAGQVGGRPAAVRPPRFLASPLIQAGRPRLRSAEPAAHAAADMSFLFGSRSSKTFKPKKNIPEGSHQYELLKHAEATLGSGNLRMAVMLPEGEDLNEWVAVNTVDFFNQINMLYGTITDFCTEESCPVMSAGPKYEYHWADGTNIKKPIKCSAPKYIDYLMTWVQDQLDDETLFPSKIGVPFPKNFMSVAKTILKRLFRVYAHIYHQHFDPVIQLQEEAHLNTSFKHFIFFVQEFNLIDRRELAPLQELIEKLTSKDR
ncbi:MOB kinase activator 1B, partial [Lemmus lemmus]